MLRFLELLELVLLEAFPSPSCCSSATRLSIFDLAFSIFSKWACMSSTLSGTCSWAFFSKAAHCLFFRLSWRALEVVPEPLRRWSGTPPRRRPLGFSKPWTGCSGFSKPRPCCCCPGFSKPRGCPGFSSPGFSKLCRARSWVCLGFPKPPSPSWSFSKLPSFCPSCHPANHPWLFQASFRRLAFPSLQAFPSLGQLQAAAGYDC